MQNPSERPRRLGAIIGAVAVLVIALGVAGRLAAQGPPGGGGPPGARPPGGGGPPGAGGASPAPSPAAPPKINTSFASANGRWAWLSQEPDKPAKLFTGPAGQPGQEIAQGKGWTSVALDGDVIWVAETTGNTGVLRQVAQDDAPEVTVRCAGKPSGLLARDGVLYWVERKVAPPQAPTFIPTLSDQVVVRARDKDAKVRDLGTWPAGAEPKGQEKLPGVIAAAEGALYVRVPRLYSTEFVQFALSGGEPKRITVENELQTGALFRGVFYWTTRSREAMPEVGMRRVCRLNGSEAETVAEWLPNSGSLAATDEGLYYVSEGVYRIPDKLGMPKRLGPAAATLGASDPKGLVLVDPSGGGPPTIFAEK